MASVQITGSPSSFRLKSTWICNASGVITSGPTTATKTVSFAVSIPSGSNITSAYVHSEWGSPKGGFAIKTVNGTYVSSSNNNNVSVSVGTTSGTVSYEFKFKSNGVSGQAGGQASGITNVSNVYLHIDYTLPYTNPTAPTSVTVSPTTAAPGGSATVSWSGGAAGTNNPITGYSVYRSDSASGTYSYHTGGSASSGSGSATVTAPTTKGSSYYYKIVLIGSASGYEYSPLSSAYATLTCSYTSPGAPTSVTISKCISTGENATLNWNVGSAGTNNPISGYRITYKDSLDLYTWSDEAVYADVGAVTSYLAPRPAEGWYRLYTVYAIGTVNDTISDGTDANAFMYYYSNSLTDDPLVSQETRIKAAHIMELQELANIIDTCYYDLTSGLYFYDVVSGETNIMEWSDHVNQLRTAIDDLGISHDDWIEITENRPTAEVMQQLRDVLLSA